MNSKERVLRIIEHKEADRVPMELRIIPGMRNKLLKYFNYNEWEDVLIRLNIDIRLVYCYWTDVLPKDSLSRGIFIDDWGIKREGLMPIEHPMKNINSIEEIERYQFPDPKKNDYSSFLKYCENSSNFAMVGLIGSAFFFISQSLMGMDNLLIKMIERPKVISYLFEKITNYYLEVQKTIYQKAGKLIDIALFGDDYGTQDSLMVSKEMWRLFIKPNLEKMFKQAKEYGYKVMFHSCGAISEIIPDLIEIGVDILEPIQPKAKGMDIIELNKKYGDKITFQGNVDTQETLPYGSKEDVKKEVIDLITNVAPGGGLIIASSQDILEDTPIENVITLYDTVIKYGNYNQLGKI